MRKALIIAAVAVSAVVSTGSFSVSHAGNTLASSSEPGTAAGKCGKRWCFGVARGSNGIKFGFYPK